jgi:uncharacterized protein (DUF2141 family)
MNTRSITPRSALALFLVLALVPSYRAPAQTPVPPTFNLSGKVLNASGAHSIYVALWDEAHFLGQPVQQIRIAPGAPLVFQFSVPPGHWALSAYEDMNNNGILDMGLFGPKEPSGFWHPFHAWRKPRFADVSVLIDRDMRSIDISLQP